MDCLFSYVGTAHVIFMPGSHPGYADGSGSRRSTPWASRSPRKDPAPAVAVRCGAQAVGGVILQTDQGAEYTDAVPRRVCERMRIRKSMAGPGRSTSNGPHVRQMTLAARARGR